MIPLAANIPLTLCSVVIRRFIDSYTGRLPLAVVSSTVPTASTVAIFSGALVCLYHQLRKGTLVNIGLGKGLSSMIRNSRHTIHNDSFDSEDYSAQDVSMADSKRHGRPRNVIGHANDLHRPVTRNFRKSQVQQEGWKEGRRQPSKKRKKLDQITNEAEDDPYTMDTSHLEERKVFKKSLQKLPVKPEESVLAKCKSKKRSEWIRRQQKAQKITRKTRSGRVYAYRL